MAAPHLIPGPGPDMGGEGTPLPPLKFGSVEEFVTKFLAPTYALDVTQTHRRKWCRQWWRHGGVTARLEGIWRAWEHYRQDPTTGMFVWFLETDKHMAWLMASDGPFELCSVKDGHLGWSKDKGGPGLPPLPIEPASPPFPDERIIRVQVRRATVPAERRVPALAVAALDGDDTPLTTVSKEPYDVD
jgi:hypothetical protein